jgi:streptogramin lyase
MLVLVVAAAYGALALAHAGAALATPLGEVTEFGVPIEGETSDITTGAEGDLWFTQHSFGKSAELGRITPEGDVTEFETALGDESGIATGSEGNLWFLSLSGAGLGELEPQTGETTRFPIQGGEPEFVGITTGAEGDLWFTQDNVGQMWRMPPGGTAQRVATGVAWTTPDYDTQGITTGAEGDIWFTEFSAGAIGRATPSGTVTQFKTGIPTGAEPTAIALGHEGDLWFTLDDNGAEIGSGATIGRITPQGNVTLFGSGSTSGLPDGIAAGPEGDMWFTELESSKVGRITPNGEIEEFQVGNPESGSKTPLAITAGAEGDMWFTEGESNAIGRIGTGSSGSRPTVTKLTPTSGSAEGGTEVTISGLHLEGATAVDFGTTAALEVKPGSAGTIVAIAPPGSAGKTVNVTVTTTSGTSTIGRADRFKYLADPLKLGPKSLKPATAGVPYSDTLHGQGGTEPYTYELVSGTLPTGIELDSTSGELSGTPEEAGASTFTIRVTDASNPALTATMQYTLETMLHITPSSLGRLTAGTPVSKTFTVSGGTAPYALSLLDLDTVPGLEFSFDEGTDEGLVSGTPTTAGTYTVTAQASDSADPQHSGSHTFKVKVGLGVEPAALAGGAVGAPYEATLEVIGGSGSYNFAVSEGTLPKGLELDAATGTISGTPTEPGKSRFTIAVTDLVTGITATVNYHVTVTASQIPARASEHELTLGLPA